MKYYSSDELARGFLGDECQNQCLTETWSVELKKKSLNFFLALAQEKTQIRHNLPPLLSRILCSSLLFVDDLFSVCFQERLCIFFSRCYSLDVRLFTYAFYCSLSCSSRRVLPILASFLARFYGVTLRRLPVAFFGRSVSLYPAYFHLKPSLHELGL